MRGLILEWLCMLNLLMVLSLDGGDASTSVKLPLNDPRHTRLSCLPCDESECTKIKKKECHWGFALDPCECCKICAKALGEPCGGLWNLGGTCGKGMECYGEDTEGQEQGPGDTDGDIWGKGLCTPISKKYCACGLPWKKTKNGKK